jgi:3-oxoacyl-[acyl-carrier-protein] synthase III
VKALIKGVQLAELAACIPAQHLGADDLFAKFGKDATRIAKVVGVERRPTALPNEHTSDLCVAAARQVVSRMERASDIGAIILVTQSPDFRLPATSFLIQELLGLSEDAVCFDVNLGCSGFVTALWMASAIISSGSTEKVLLLAGETISKYVEPTDRSTYPLFADAGAAALVVKGDVGDEIRFSSKSYGSKAGALTIPAGNYPEKSFPDVLNGNPTKLQMDGQKVFDFTMNEVVSTVREALTDSALTTEEITTFLPHQASGPVLSGLTRKLGFDRSKVVNQLANYGNTSAASIPVAACAEFGDNGCPQGPLLMAGFGVGLSISTAVLRSAVPTATHVVLTL